jgi:coenzyme F420-reducing hydrogenase alpha subunit
VSTRIVLNKATRIEGNANIYIEVEDGRVKAARFMVPDFRGFEKILQGCPVEQAPAMISRVCGLCSTAHQVASIDAIERALGIQATPGLVALREIVVLGEWIASHALSYFFLAMPDLLDAQGGIAELARTHPDAVREAFALRDAGQRIVCAIGKRAMHPVSLAIGRFLIAPSKRDLDEVRRSARDAQARSRRLILETLEAGTRRERIAPPAGQRVNLLVHENGPGDAAFTVYGREGDAVLSFARGEFEDNVAEMRTEWTRSKFPYLAQLGFPAGIVLVGPLARTFGRDGILRDPELVALGVPARLDNRRDLALDDVDFCRLVEIFWAARRIDDRLEDLDLETIRAEGNMVGSGQGLGVLEAPRGVLVHSYLVDRGRVERLRLLVATQFNNAFINLLLHDLAERHIERDRVTPEGERIIGRSVRIFDPCLSCATH